MQFCNKPSFAMDIPLVESDLNWNSMTELQLSALKFMFMMPKLVQILPHLTLPFLSYNAAVAAEASRVS